MWIVSCTYPSGLRRDLFHYRIRTHAEEEARQLQKLMGRSFKVEACFEVSGP